MMDLSNHIRDLANRTGMVRYHALQRLEDTSTPLALLAARAGCTDPEQLVRAKAAEMLGVAGNQQDIMRLCNLLQDPEWVVRASAASSLGDIGGKRALRLLQRALTDPNPGVRRYAAVALAELGSDARPFLHRALETEKSPSALTGILSALYSLGESESLGPLLSLLFDDDYHVTCQVLNALECIVEPNHRATVAGSVRRLLKSQPAGAVTSAAEKVLELMSANSKGE